MRCFRQLSAVEMLNDYTRWLWHVRCRKDLRARWGGDSRILRQKVSLNRCFTAEISMEDHSQTWRSENRKLTDVSHFYGAEKLRTPKADFKVDKLFVYTQAAVTSDGRTLNFILEFCGVTPDSCTVEESNQCTRKRSDRHISNISRFDLRHGGGAVLRRFSAWLIWCLVLLEVVLVPHIHDHCIALLPHTTHLRILTINIVSERDY